MGNYRGGWTKRATHDFVYAPVKRGALGRIKPTANKVLAGKQVRYVGKIRSQHFVKLLEAAEGYSDGATFVYQLNWVEWD